MPATVATTEAEWQEQVIQLAHALGWRHLHVRRSIGKGRKWTTATNIPWPDLTLWHTGQGRLIVAELKTDTGTVTDGQLATLASLMRAGTEAHIWRPADLDDVHRTLAGSLWRFTDETLDLLTDVEAHRERRV